MTTQEFATNAEIIGRDEINDIEAILSVVNHDVDEIEHAVKDNADAIFTWDYTLARPALRKLYEEKIAGSKLTELLEVDRVGVENEIRSRAVTRLPVFRGIEVLAPAEGHRTGRRGGRVGVFHGPGVEVSLGLHLVIRGREGMDVAMRAVP